MSTAGLQFVLLGSFYLNLKCSQGWARSFKNPDIVLKLGKDEKFSSLFSKF